MNSGNSGRRGFFISLRRDQLGARLLMILNCIRLADDYQSDYRINWFPKGAAAPKLDHPEELFTQDYMDRHFIANADYEALKENTEPIHAFFRDPTPERLNAHLAAGKHVLLSEGFEVVVFPWEESGSIESRYGGFIRRLGLHSQICRKMEIIDDALGKNGGKSVAYHIRRGDILNEKPWRDGMWPSKIEPDELYWRHLDTSDAGVALVFSDQDECIGRLQAHHPNVQSIKDIVDLDDCMPCQRDFLELYAMSRAEKIIAPVISAFSSAAARLSGRERLRFVDVLDPPQIDEAYNNVVKRFNGGLENFVNLSEAAQIYSRLARHLALNDREEEGYAISSALIKAGADNAFLPMLHAVNCIYLNKWEEGREAIDKSLAAPGLWKEDYASALALKAHIVGALGDAAEARKSWIRAFWMKPYLPDVIVTGSAMLEKNRLRSGADIYFDRNILDAIRVPYMQRDILTVQRKMLRQRPVDFSLLVLEWPYFVLDRKAQRLLDDHRRIGQIRTTLGRDKGKPGEDPPRDSYRGLMQSLLGHHKSAQGLTGAAVEAAPDDFLVNKRRAEVLWAAGRPYMALRQLRHLRDLEPENPFGLFLLGRFLEEADKPQEALIHYETAAAHDDVTAAIHAALASCYKKLGRTEEAVAILGRATSLAPTFQKFSNQRERLLRQGKKPGGRVVQTG